MSVTSGAVRDERMLRGVTAFGWARANILLYLAAMILIVPWAILSFTGHVGQAALLLLVPAIVAGLAAFVCAAGGFLRTRSETEAGYTTLPGTSPNLDQLDFRTGTVIRRAGQPLLASRSFLAFVRGDSGRPRDALAADQPAFPPQTPARMLAAVAPGIVGVVVFIGIAVVRGIRDPVATFSLYASIIGFFAVVVLLVSAYTRATLVRRIRQISESRPDAMIFTSGMTPDIQMGMERLGVTQTSTSGRFPVAVTDTAIELWSNETPPVMRLAVPWGEIQAIAPDSVSISRNPFKAVDIQVVHDEVTVQLPLGIYGQQGIRGASSAWANQVFDEIRHHVRA